MDTDVLVKLDKMLDRYRFLEKEISKPDFYKDPLFLDLSKEISSLKKFVLPYIKYKKICDDISDLSFLLKDDDSDIRKLTYEELNNLEKVKIALEVEIASYFSIKSREVYNSIFLEIRAATGGDESAIFVEDLFRMYSCYFAYTNWVYEIMNISYGNYGGYKDVTLRVLGSDVFEKMKDESGIHRVQRIPKTETHGRIHTSTCSVAVLPEVEIVSGVNIDLNDLRIDTYRASGAGGQHVNVTDSAVRITHKPTGIIAECQDERSQHKNKQKALSLLKSRLLLFERNKQKYEIDDYRRRLIGTGIRSEKIRTYNYSGNRITDHRSNVTIYKLNDVMSGKLWLLWDNLK